ncbi:MAG: ABC transporter permease [Chloroflexi bacterium]|nr:ABC transporter permease [Chloroflexota bacterium]
MRRFGAFIIRTSSFIMKELREILRQTRLMLALVLGPFLILLLFGLGFRNEARVLRTMFVVPKEDQSVREQVQTYATTLGPQLDFRGVTDNEGDALALLSTGAVDAVAVIPGDVENKIRNSEQPVVHLYHREIDPFQVSYIEYVAQIYVDELNRRVLRSMAEEGQQSAGDVQDELQAARASARAMREAFERGDQQEAQRERTQLNSSMDSLTLSVGTSLGVLAGVQQAYGTSDESAAGQILSSIEQIRMRNEELGNSSSDQGSYNEEAQQSAEIEQDLEQLEEQLQDFRQIDPQVLVSPFTSKAVSISSTELTSSEFFSPGVIVLLLQHLLTTFAALSIVRERLSETMELFRVAPISAFETLLGKYLSYFFIGAMLAAAISALVVLVLRVPMFGSWANFAAVLAALMFAALGIGFLISLLSETTSQAVQYAMLVLLFSIFFSGFFLDLRLMWENLRFVAWMIPATYGLQMLQEIMFRANPINPLLMGGLLGIGLLLFLLSWAILRRQMRTR